MVNEQSNLGSQFQASGILKEVSKRLQPKCTKDQQTILTIWHDLFRVGMLAPGYDLLNPSLPYMHITDAGRKTLENVSRDPSNPDGYIAHLYENHLTDEIALSYIREAILTYNSACFKASAVMVGCATERLVLLVRDELVSGLQRQGNPIQKGLRDWRYKTVRDAVTTELEPRVREMQPRRLAEAYSGFWTPLTEQPRLYRNDAGHPLSIDPVSQDTVHSNLLIFPQLSNLVAGLVGWVRENYSK